MTGSDIPEPRRQLSPDAESMATEHGITPIQAQRLIDEHGHDKLKEDGVLTSLLHFLKAPS